MTLNALFSPPTSIIFPPVHAFRVQCSQHDARHCIRDLRVAWPDNKYGLYSVRHRIPGSD